MMVNLFLLGARLGGKVKKNASKNTLGCQDFTAKRRFAPLLLAALLGDIPPETVASTIQPPVGVAYFFTDGPTPASFSFYFCLFVQKINLVVIKIRTQTVGVKCKEADHKSTTAAPRGCCK